MEQPYLTRLNNLAAAWPSVYNGIDKLRVQVMKFEREARGGMSSSPAARGPSSVCVCVYLLLCFMDSGQSPRRSLWICADSDSHLMYFYIFKTNVILPQKSKEEQ